MPSRHQLRWAELRVGITVFFALVVLAVLIFLMTGTMGFFTSKVHLLAFFDDAGGLRPGAPVRLNGVDAGNVESVIFIPSHAPTPVEVRMILSSKFLSGLHTDTTAKLTTAGVLGEVYVNLDSSFAKGPEPKDGAVLPTKETIDLEDMVVAGQSTLQNVQALINRINNILNPIEQGRGSIGKLIKDEELYDRMNATLAELQSVVNKVSSGQGSIGKLINNDDLYNKANNSVDKLNRILDSVEQGKGTVGKLLKDPSLYNNANNTVAQMHELVEGVNQGKGALGMVTRDQAFAAKLNNTMTRLDNLVTKLDSGQGTAGKLMNDPSLYVNADQMLTETRNLVTAIRQNPKKYLTIHFRVF